LLAACTPAEDDAGSSDQDQTTAREEFEEEIRPGEQAEFRRFMTEMNEIQKQASTESRHPITRGFHAKSHACVAGQLRVLPDRDARARFGVFANDTTYPAWIRFSNGQGVSRPDSKSDARGLAVKLVGIEGQKLLEGDREFASEQGAQTQDFLMTNKPRSTARDSRGFMAFAKATAKLGSLQGAVQDRDAIDGLASVPGVVSAFDDFLAVGTEDLPNWDLVGKAKIRLANAQMLKETLTRTKRRVDSMAEEQFWSGSAYKLGPKAVKYSFRPCEDLHKPERPKDAPDDYLAQELAQHMKSNTTCFDLVVQFQLDAGKQPVEDAFKLWDEKESPPLRIAQLLIPPTDLEDPAAQADTEYCSHLAFTPWHGLTEHRPLGNINRARKFVLKASQSLRQSADALIDEKTVHASARSMPMRASTSSGARGPAALEACPAADDANPCDDCVRAMCAKEKEHSSCADVDCVSYVESLCKECKSR
jgi:hypothetical protein